MSEDVCLNNSTVSTPIYAPQLVDWAYSYSVLLMKIILLFFSVFVLSVMNSGKLVIFLTVVIKFYRVLDEIGWKFIINFYYTDNEIAIIVRCIWEDATCSWMQQLKKIWEIMLRKNVVFKLLLDLSCKRKIVFVYW